MRKLRNLTLRIRSSEEIEAAAKLGYDLETEPHFPIVGGGEFSPLWAVADLALKLRNAANCGDAVLVDDRIDKVILEFALRNMLGEFKPLMLKFIDGKSAKPQLTILSLDNYFWAANKA
jgi:hypothetical protein